MSIHGLGLFCHQVTFPRSHWPRFNTNSSWARITILDATVISLHISLSTHITSWSNLHTSPWAPGIKHHLISPLLAIRNRDTSSSLVQIEETIFSSFRLTSFFYIFSLLLLIQIRYLLALYHIDLFRLISYYLLILVSLIYFIYCFLFKWTLFPSPVQSPLRKKLGTLANRQCQLANYMSENTWKET